MKVKKRFIRVNYYREEKEIENELWHLKPIGMIFLIMLPINFFVAIGRIEIAIWFAIIIVLLCSSNDLKH